MNFLHLLAWVALYSNHVMFSRDFDYNIMQSDGGNPS